MARDNLVLEQSEALMTIKLITAKNQRIAKF